MLAEVVERKVCWQERAKRVRGNKMENVVRATALRSPQSRNSGCKDWTLALFLLVWVLSDHWG